MVDEGGKGVMRSRVVSHWGIVKDLMMSQHGCQSIINLYCMIIC